jgi:hypothetical protein
MTGGLQGLRPDPAESETCRRARNSVDDGGCDTELFDHEDETALDLSRGNVTIHKST